MGIFFRQINFLVISLVKPLLSRNFCQKSGNRRNLLSRPDIYVKSERFFFVLVKVGLRHRFQKQKLGQIFKLLLRFEIFQQFVQQRTFIEMHVPECKRVLCITLTTT